MKGVPVPKMKNPSRPPLNTDTIVEAAVALADREGLGSLSMRRLARTLGYEVMSLYNHVANKAELLGLMVDWVARNSAGVPAGGLGEGVAMAEVRALAIGFRHILVQHPWATGLWQQHLPGPGRIAHMEQLLVALDRCGLAPDLAHHGFHAVINHVLGYSLQELSMHEGLASQGPMDEVVDRFLSSVDAHTYPLMVAHVHQHLNGETDSSFELVLDLIIEGLWRTNHARKPPASG